MTEKKIYKVPVISPRGFLIEIIDSEQNPVTGVEFNYVVDGSFSKKGTTDDRGILNVLPMPQNEIKLSLDGGVTPDPNMLRGDLGILVVDNNTHQPISQANVSATGPESLPSCMSGDNGIVIFHNIHAGNYTITAFKPDFSSDTQQATVIAGASVGANPSASGSNDAQHFTGNPKDTGNEPIGDNPYAILRLFAKTHPNLPINTKHFKIRLVNPYGKAYDRKKFRLSSISSSEFNMIDVTKNDGTIEAEIPFNTEQLYLDLFTDYFEDPIRWMIKVDDVPSEKAPQGASIRLRNLGYYNGEITQEMTNLLHDAIELFQWDSKLLITRELDDLTWDELKKKHDY